MGGAKTLDSLPKIKSGSTLQLRPSKGFFFFGKNLLDGPWLIVVSELSTTFLGDEPVDYRLQHQVMIACRPPPAFTNLFCPSAHRLCQFEKFPGTGEPRCLYPLTSCNVTHHQAKLHKRKYLVSTSTCYRVVENGSHC